MPELYAHLLTDQRIWYQALLALPPPEEDEDASAVSRWLKRFLEE